jgi:hypothetical protein
VPKVKTLPVKDIKKWRRALICDHGSHEYFLSAPTGHLPNSFIHLVKALMTGTEPGDYQPESMVTMCKIDDKMALLMTILAPFER